MKKAVFIALFAALLLLLPVSAAAAEDSTGELTGSLPERARAIFEDETAFSSLDAGGVFGRIGGAIKDMFSGIFKNALKGAAAVLASAILCGLASALCGTEGRGAEYVSVAGVAAIGAAALSSAGPLLGGAASAVEELAAFSNALLPTLTASAAAAGGAASSAAKYAATMLFVGVMTTLGKNVIMPLIYMYLAASAADAAFGRKEAGGAAKLIKQVTVTLLGGMATAFTLYLTLTGALASAADATAVKLTKAAVSAVLPVVGGIVSDAAEAVVSGAGMLKNGVSVFGMLAVCAVCAAPFLKLAVGSLVYKAAAALSETVAPGRVAGFINAVGTALGLALALAGTAAVMLFVSIVSFMKTVT